MSFKLLQQDGFGILLEDSSGYVLFDSNLYDPVTNITTTNFTGTATAIDEYNPDDTDFIFSANATIGIYEDKFAAMSDPINKTGHILTYRIANMNAGVLSGTAFAQVTAELYQGAILIKADVIRTASASWVTYTLILTNLEANTITNYTDLRVRFTTTNVALRGIGISYTSFTIPNYVAPVAENQIANSEDVSGWIKTNSTVSADVANAPTGAFTSDKLVENTATSTHTLQLVRIIPPNEMITASLYAQGAGRNYMSFGFSNAVTTSINIDVDLTSGLMGSEPAGNSDYSSFHGYTKNMGNGWYFISVTAIKGKVSTINRPDIRMQDTFGNSSYLGDGVSGINIWGVQINGGTVAYDYIKTPTPTVKKLAAMGVG